MALLQPVRVKNWKSRCDSSDLAMVQMKPFGDDLAEPVPVSHCVMCVNDDLDAIVHDMDFGMQSIFDPKVNLFSGRSTVRFKDGSRQVADINFCWWSMDPAGLIAISCDSACGQWMPTDGAQESFFQALKVSLTRQTQNDTYDHRRRSCVALKQKLFQRCQRQWKNPRTLLA